MQKNFIVPFNSVEFSLFEGRKRTIYDIYAAMLQVCQKPQNKTHIMYKTNTTYISFAKNLQFLQEAGLLQQELLSKNEFQITEQGRIFLEKYGEMRQLLDGNLRA